MKKEILGILVCMLFIVSVFPSSSFSLNDGPYVEITWPSDEYESSESNIIVTGFTSGELPLKEYGYIINYPDGGVFSEFWPFNPPVEYYEFEISIDLIEGLEGNMVTVYAKDTQDNQGTDSLTVYYVPEGEDNEPPEVVIIYPVDNAIFIDPEISLLGYVDDNVGMVIFTAYQIWNDEEYLIHSDVFTDPLISYEFNFVVTLKPGLNTLKVTAYDAADNKGEDIVNVTKDYECGHKTPTITDNSGNTTFYGLFIGINYQYQDSEIFGPENNARTLAAHLLEKPGWDEENIRILTADNASGFWIETYLRWAKANAQPGDEFLFHFSGHGGNDSIGEGSHPDELNDPDFPWGHDEHIYVADGVYSDDVLRDLLSGFSDCVTINVKLDCCHAGGFIDGWWDIQNATNDQGMFYGDDHINIETACEANETTGGRPYFWDDVDDDGVIDIDELIPTGRPYEWQDTNGNGRYDSFWDILYYWWDKDNDGYADADELMTPREVTWLGDFTKANIEGLQNDSGFNKNFNLDDPIPTTKSDRNKDGITTLKELYEFSINFLNDWFSGDNDNDGLIDEDGYDFEEINGTVKELYIDNDGDGYFDEDPSPPSFAFWYDEPPNKPSKPSGLTSGKAGEQYTYTTSAIDPENDDVFYMFEWGDGTESDWFGPYSLGSICSITNTWNEIGDYQIRVKSRDRCYAESPWSDPLPITMPKNKAINPFLLFLERLIERFPILEQIIQPIYNMLVNL